MPSWVPSLVASWALVCALAAGVLAVDLLASTRENIEYRCLVNAPASGISSAENALVAARATLFPAGRECVWRAVDGGLIVEQTGWLTTSAFVVCGIGALVIAILCLAAWRYLWALVPLALCLAAALVAVWWVSLL